MARFPLLVASLYLFLSCAVCALAGIPFLSARKGTTCHSSAPLSELCADKNDATIADAQITVNRYIESCESKGRFLVLGWRWHTMSLVRESLRLHRLASKLLTSNELERDSVKMNQAAQYVVGFNMQGLHNVEKDVFFPWLRRQRKSIRNITVAHAFETIVNRLDTDRKVLEQLGTSLILAADTCSDITLPDKLRYQAISRIALNSEQIMTKARYMLQLEDSVIIPVIAMFVPELEQRAFNNQVIRRLGVLDSRLHLVGMYEAIVELNDENEQDLFQEMIPSIPRRMIPRWKRLLYQPQAGVLDEV